MRGIIRWPTRGKHKYKLLNAPQLAKRLQVWKRNSQKQVEKAMYKKTSRGANEIRNIYVIVKSAANRETKRSITFLAETSVKYTQI